MRYPTGATTSPPARRTGATYTCNPSELISSGSLSSRNGGAFAGRRTRSGFVTSTARYNVDSTHAAYAAAVQQYGTLEQWREWGRRSGGAARTEAFAPAVRAAPGDPGPRARRSIPQ